jgi:hypothetical protein
MLEFFIIYCGLLLVTGTIFTCFDCLFDAKHNYYGLWYVKLFDIAVVCTWITGLVYIIVRIGYGE